MPIAIALPSGDVWFMTLNEERLQAALNPRETKDETVLRLARLDLAKIQLNPGASLKNALPPALVKTADVPTDREKRHAWRLSGGKVIVDATIPDPPKGKP
jgi:hypothetical protein